MIQFIGQETNPLAAVPANGTFASGASAAACSAGSLDGRRKFFGGTKNGASEAIDRAIDVAVVDRPQELWSRLPRLVSSSHPLRPPHPSGCKRVDLGGSAEAEGSRSAKKAPDGSKSDAAEMFDRAAASKLSAGTFTAEPRDERRIVEDVMAVKAVLEQEHDESDIFVYELLSLLMKMQVSYQALQETKIGFVVRAFHKRKSKKIRSLVRKIIQQWRTVVDKWLESTDASMELPTNQNEGKDKNSEKIKAFPGRPPLPRKPMVAPRQKKPMCTEQDPFKAKLEIAKRKFQELYGENGKRQRTEY